MHKKQVYFSGKEIGEAQKALVMIHGRGSNAGDILSLASYLNVGDYALVAPQATNHTWYPQSFLAPPALNEPWLSSALALLKEITADISRQGIPSQNIYFLGFSQGACLTLEFVTRNATRWGGVAAFTGGLIGDRLYEENYSGDFGRTPVFIGSADPDPHVPAQRVQDTVAELKKMNAAVTEKIYPGMGHTIIQDEVDLANRLIFRQ